LESFQSNSLQQEDEGDEAELLGASAWRQVHCNGGASSTLAAVVLGSMVNRRKTRGRRGDLAAAPWGDARVSWDLDLVGIKREEGKESRSLRGALT
jgi:hypothetical protein